MHESNIGVSGKTLAGPVSCGRGFVSGSVSAMQYVIDNGITVSNSSWGSISFSQALYDSIEASQAIGHIFVASAGNGDIVFGNPISTDVFPHYPAAYDLPNIISVAATNNDDDRASFTNYGPTTVDLGAPGVHTYSTLLGTDYGFASGTSMAAPHVTGVTALLMTRLPDLTWHDVRDRVLLTVRPIDALRGLTATGGVINALAAVGDCNENGVLDEYDVGGGTSVDCNDNGIPDECEVYDCNNNGVPDSCDVAHGTSGDCNDNGIPDECEPDCNDNGVPDICDLTGPTSDDCNGNNLPDECEPGGTEDCNDNAAPDRCDIDSIVSRDCNNNDVPDECEIAEGTLHDSDSDGLADECVLGFFLVPVSATGAHTIEDDRIFLSDGGQTVTLDTYVSGWDLDLDGEPLVRACQAAPDPASFANPLSGSLDFAASPCDTFDDCRAGEFARGWCSDTGLCTVHTAIYTDVTNSDFIFSGSQACTGAYDYTEEYGTAWTGSLLWNTPDSRRDLGVPKYIATFRLNVSPDAEGAFVVNFFPDQGNWTFCNDTDVMRIPIDTYVPAFIILPSDCNGNGVPDYDDLVGGTSEDCNNNLVADECETPDCNENAAPDECDLSFGTSDDYNRNHVPDECDPDCNANAIPDDCDLACGIGDCLNHPSGCGTGDDYNGNSAPDACDPDCNANGVPDDCDLNCSIGDCLNHPSGCGASDDYNANSAPDECDPDCNTNGVPDDCDSDCEIGDCLIHPSGCGGSADCNYNAVPDECEPDEDCNNNGVQDICDIAGDTSDDCQPNGVPDECDLTEGTSDDLNGNAVPDECDAVVPWPENSLGVTDCTDDDQCDQEARCVQGICYAPKQRYLSIARNPEQVDSTARCVRLDNGTQLGWVGQPHEEDLLQEPGGIWLAEIVDNPVYVTTWPDVVHVRGCQIAHANLCDPSGVHCNPNPCAGGETCVQHSYHVQAIAIGQDVGNEHNYSGVLELHTPSTWGDTVSTIILDNGRPPNGINGIEDIMAAIKKYQIVDVAPITWLDIDPSTGNNMPDQAIGVDDIMSCIDGYQGNPYPGLGPLNCP